MTPATLRALRDLMFLTAEDAARLLAAGDERPDGVQPRSWMAWERGEKPIPGDVAVRVRTAWAARQTILAGERQRIADDDARFGAERIVTAVYYQRPDRWPGDPLSWRLHCSALAELAATDERVELVSATEASTS